jgi:hypothetical protein
MPYVFVTAEVTVPARLEDAVARLRHLINHGALHSTSQEAYEGGLSAVVRVGPFGPVPGLSRRVRVLVAEPVQRGAAVTMPMRWEAAGAAGDLFPVLDADLTLTAEAPDRVQVRLDGVYRPPLGRAGEAVDQLVMHRLAAATMKALMTGLAPRLSDPGKGSQPRAALADAGEATLNPISIQFPGQA